MHEMLALLERILRDIFFQGLLAPSPHKPKYFNRLTNYG
jgi:hypothetical protein